MSQNICTANLNVWIFVQLDKFYNWKTNQCVTGYHHSGDTHHCESNCQQFTAAHCITEYCSRNIEWTQRPLVSPHIKSVIWSHAHCTLLNVLNKQTLSKSGRQTCELSPSRTPGGIRIRGTPPRSCGCTSARTRSPRLSRTSCRTASCTPSSTCTAQYSTVQYTVHHPAPLLAARVVHSPAPRHSELVAVLLVPDALCAKKYI